MTGYALWRPSHTERVIRSEVLRPDDGAVRSWPPSPVFAGVAALVLWDIVTPVCPNIRAWYRTHDDDPRRRRIGRAALSVTIAGGALLLWHHLLNPRGSSR